MILLLLYRHCVCITAKTWGHLLLSSAAGLGTTGLVAAGLAATLTGRLEAVLLISPPAVLLGRLSALTLLALKGVATWSGLSATTAILLTRSLTATLTGGSSGAGPGVGVGVGMGVGVGAPWLVPPPNTLVPTGVTPFSEGKRVAELGSVAFFTAFSAGATSGAETEPGVMINKQMICYGGYACRQKEREETILCEAISSLDYLLYPTRKKQKQKQNHTSLLCGNIKLTPYGGEAVSQRRH